MPYGYCYEHRYSLTVIGVLRKDMLDEFVLQCNQVSFTGFSFILAREMCGSGRIKRSTQGVHYNFVRYQ